MTPQTTDSTKDRLLDSAERLFSEQGFAGTSLRAITSDADVNLASVNYHFKLLSQICKDMYISKLHGKID